MFSPNTIFLQASRSGHHPQAPQNNNQDVINLQYMELEEFLLENAVAVTVPEHKGRDIQIHFKNMKCLKPLTLQNV